MDEGSFSRLSLSHRADVLWQQGVFVDSVLLSHYLLMLYSVNGQFVEMSYDVSEGNIVWISVANEHDLDKYLEGINIGV